MRMLLAALVLTLSACASLPPYVPPTPPAQPPLLGIGANVGTDDLLSAFSTAGRADWPVTFAQMDFYQFHAIQLLPGCGGVDHCGPNTWESVRDAGLIGRLRAAGKRIGVEHAALKEWDCTGDILRSQLADLFALVPLDIVGMDWPFAGAHHADCNLSHEQAAAVIAQYVQRVEQRGAEAWLIEGWPRWDVPHFFQHLDAVTQATATLGTRLSAVSLDLDVAFGRDPAAIRALVEGVRARGYRVGVILTGDDGSVDRWAASARWRANLILRTYLNCHVDYVLVESWAVGTDGRKRGPPMLPETDAASLTAIARTEACQ